MELQRLEKVFNAYSHANTNEDTAACSRPNEQVGLISSSGVVDQIHAHGPVDVLSYRATEDMAGWSLDLQDSFAVSSNDLLTLAEELDLQSFV